MTVLTRPLVVLGALVIGTVAMFVGVFIAGVGRPEPVQGRDRPAPTVEVREQIVDVGAEYREAAKDVWFEAADIGKEWGMAEVLRARLAAGVPIGNTWVQDVIRPPLLRWAEKLSRAARDEYARRCLTLAAKIKAGEEPRIPHYPDIQDPLSLYDTAYHLAVDDGIRDRAVRLFYTEADRQHRLAVEKYEARHGPGSAGPLFARGADGAVVSLGTAGDAPHRRRMFDWSSGLRGVNVPVPDPR